MDFSKWALSRLVSTPRKEPNWGYDIYKCEVPKIRGTYFGGPCNKDPTI